MDAAADELRRVLAAQDPEFLHYLMYEHEVPADFVPEAHSRAILERTHCWTCETPTAALRCSRCKLARYCGVECQRLDYDEHRQVCAVDRAVRDMAKAHIYAGHVRDGAN